MEKARYKKVNGKNTYVQDRLYHKGIFCISKDWIKWAKKYLNRSYRRKNKQTVKGSAKQSPHL